LFILRLKVTLERFSEITYLCVFANFYWI